MGKRRWCVGLALGAALWLMISLGPSTAIATPTTASCAIGDITVEDGSLLIIEISSVSSQRAPSELGTILVPPVAGMPGKADVAKHWEFENGFSFNYSATLRLTLVHNQTSQYLQGGDEMVIQSTGGASLPEGTWQLYLIDEETGYASFGITWVIGNATSEAQKVPYAPTGVTDPMAMFGLDSGGDSKMQFMVIFGVEALVLALMLLFISRTE